MDTIELNIKVKEGTVLFTGDMADQFIIITEETTKTKRGFLHTYTVMSKNEKEVYDIPEKGTELYVISQDISEFNNRYKQNEQKIFII